MWQHASAGGALFQVVYHRRDPGRWSAPVHRVASRSAHIAVGAGHGRLSSTWLKYLGPGPEEGASLKGGSCAPSWHNRSVEACLIVEGGTSRLRAKRAGECDGLTGLPEANAGSPGPRPRSPPAWSTRFRAPGCGSSPTGESRKVAAALKADLHRPEPGGRLAGSDRLLRVRHGGQVPPDGDDLGAVHSLSGLPSDAQACHLSPTSWEVPPPPTVSRLRATSCARITDEPRPLPLSMRR